MSVYVDPLRRYIGHGFFHGKASCHLYADTLDELHEMADTIGLRRVWFQNDAAMPHYDLVAARRQAAIRSGAVEHSRRQMVDFMRAYREERHAVTVGA